VDSIEADRLRGNDEGAAVETREGAEMVTDFKLKIHFENIRVAFSTKNKIVSSQIGIQFCI
jgi:hypothetical protein